MSDTTPHPLAQNLMIKGYLSEEKYARAATIADKEELPVAKVLVRERFVSEAHMCEVIAEATGIPYADPDALLPDPNATALLPAEWAHRIVALPFELQGNSVVVAMADPGNLGHIDDLQRLMGRDVIPALSPPTALARKVEQVFQDSTELHALRDTFASNDFAEVEEADDGDTDEAPVVKYVNLVLQQAVADRASDIHIEPTASDMWVRFRIDGVLHDRMHAPLSMATPVASRIKIMGGMDISERRIPQDGRLSVTVNNRAVDLRVATIPTVHGEKIVMRILDNSSTPVSLAEVGMSEENQRRYSEEYQRPYGMILVCGPTGSGKSTTLSTTLSTVKSPELNIITVEDPVEYQMAGVSQMQINKKAGLDFATALRSILRADPDIVLVGEIRDRETAQISVEAALTGHLVLSTLHTNDAPSAVTRLVEMGIEPFLVGSAMNIVIAQRLIRRLCGSCSEEYTPDADYLKAINFLETENEPVLRRPVGCDRCAQTGYRGRSAIHELLVTDPTIERMTSDGAHADQIREYALQTGMTSMRDDGWAKALAGITTIEEVLRVSV